MQASIQQIVTMVGVLISIVGGAATGGYLFGRNELSERVSVVEQRLLAHNSQSVHSDAVTRREFERAFNEVANDISEIKESVLRIR